MSVIAVVAIDGVAQTSGYLGGFVGDDLRGVTAEYHTAIPGVPGWEYGGWTPFTFLVYGNEGDVFTFKFEDSNNNVFSIVPDPFQMVTFVKDTGVGEYEYPLVLNALTTVTQTLALTTGWTWVSSPLLDGSLNLVLGDMGGFANNSDQVKSHYAFASYIAGYGWFGVLEELEPDGCYRVMMASGGEVTLTGTPADVTGRTISLNSGWTWLGWPSMTASSTSAFDDALTFPDLLDQSDQIKSQFEFTSYRILAGIRI